MCRTEYIMKHITTILLLALSFRASAQTFNLMSATVEQKIAESPFFTITNNTMNLYANTNLVSPYAVIYSDTFVVERPASTTGVANNQAEVNNFALDQNYPNPFNMSTVIRYSLPQDADVTVKVYDIVGKEIETLVNSKQAAGVHSVGFGKNNLSSGTYFYRLTATSPDGQTHVETKKMIVMK